MYVCLWNESSVMSDNPPRQRSGKTEGSSSSFTTRFSYTKAPRASVGTNTRQRRHKSHRHEEVEEEGGKTENASRTEEEVDVHSARSFGVWCSSIAGVLWDGIMSGISLHRTLPVYAQSRAIGVKTLQLLALNTAVIVGGYLLQTYPDLPVPLINNVADSVGLSLDTRQLTVSDILRVARYHLSNGNNSAAIWYACGMSQLVAAQWISYLIFHLGGILPLYVISFVLSSVWFIDVAKFAHRIYEVQQDGNVTKPPTDISPIRHYEIILQSLSEMAYRIVLTGILYLQAMVALFIPGIGQSLSFSISCFLYAFVAFDYKWSLEQWSLTQRIRFAEARWLWFVGFGIPITIVSFFGNFLTNAGLYAISLPFMIVLTMGYVEPQRTPVYQPLFFADSREKQPPRGEVSLLFKQIWDSFASLIMSLLRVPSYFLGKCCRRALNWKTVGVKNEKAKVSNTRWTVFTLPLYLTLATIELVKFMVRGIRKTV
eukprot:gb/GECG01013480.1/.p1 GENE.gb/GECG01013480.1/~~gb/GECG01013480.1/.p1  ORF type:complete len:485 (+),score=23.34 gb/GECG01013480.1/:1-1455(+)